MWRGIWRGNKPVKNPEPLISFTPESSITLTPIIKDETINWKTYRNDKYGFEIKYSDSYIITDDTETQSYKKYELFLNLDSKNNIDAGGIRRVSEIFIGILSNIKNLSIKDWIKEAVNIDTEFPLQEWPIEYIKINNSDNIGILGVSDATRIDQEWKFYVTNGKYIYIFSTNFLGGPEEDFKQILSTFKFIDSVPELN